MQTHTHIANVHELSCTHTQKRREAQCGAGQNPVWSGQNSVCSWVEPCMAQAEPGVEWAEAAESARGSCLQ